MQREVHHIARLFTLGGGFLSNYIFLTSGYQFNTNNANQCANPAMENHKQAAQPATQTEISTFQEPASPLKAFTLAPIWGSSPIVHSLAS